MAKKKDIMFFGKNITDWESESSGGILAGHFITGLFFSFLGLYLSIFVMALPWLKSKQSQSWREVPCKISSSYTEVVGHSKGSGPTYSAEIFYFYKVGTKNYSSDQITFGSPWSHEAHAIVARYPSGTIRQCFVNPKNLTDVVLIREFKIPYPWVLFSIGLALTLLGGAVLWMSLLALRIRFGQEKGLRPRRKKEEAQNQLSKKEKTSKGRKIRRRNRK